MSKKFWLSVLAVFVWFTFFSYLVNGVMLMSTYEATKNVWRPDMISLLWIYHVLAIIGAFFFVFVFSRGYEGKGMAEGARYGLYIGIWMGVGYAYGTYAMIAIPYSLALTWFLSTVFQDILAGVIVAAIYGKNAMVSRPAKS